MIQFEDIDSRLKSLGKNRAWLAEISGRSAGSIRSALAPNAESKHRSALLQRALTDAIEQEEARQKYMQEPADIPVLLPDRISVEVPGWRMNTYLAAAKSEGKDIKEWTIDKLNEAAERWRAEQARANIRLAEEPPILPSSPLAKEL